MSDMSQRFLKRRSPRNKYTNLSIRNCPQAFFGSHIHKENNLSISQSLFYLVQFSLVKQYWITNSCTLSCFGCRTGRHTTQVHVNQDWSHMFNAERLIFYLFTFIQRKAKKWAPAREPGTEAESLWRTQLDVLGCIFHRITEPLDDL